MFSGLWSNVNRALGLVVVSSVFVCQRLRGMAYPTASDVFQVPHSLFNRPAMVWGASWSITE